METSNTNAEKACQVCGYGGAESQHMIATCSRCFESHEHLYCMFVLRPKMPKEDWICELCDNPMTTTVESGGKEEKSFQRHSAPTKYLKPTGKVKYIGHDEVIKLVSGNATSASPKRSHHSGLNRKLFSANRLQKSTPAHAFPKPSVPTENTMVNKYPRDINVIDYVEAYQVPTSLRSSKLPVREKAITDIYGAANTNTVPSPSTRPIRPELENFPSDKRIVGLLDGYLPSLDGTWKGSISIVDATSRSETIIEGFQAQPPTHVHRQVYRVLQKLPPILQLKMVPRAKRLGDLCLESDLDLHHVGLYFFPPHTAALSSRFDNLFVRMEMEESVMTCRVEEYELTIFTSKHLKVDMEMSNFLWGLVKKASKGKQIVCRNSRD